jgi:hypothetical protein
MADTIGKDKFLLAAGKPALRSRYPSHSADPNRDTESPIGRRRVRAAQNRADYAEADLPFPPKLTEPQEVGSSVGQDRQIELAQALRVDQHIDLDNLLAPDYETEYEE